MMTDSLRQRLSQTANFARYRQGQTAGHYESYFQRANHPDRPLAFWVRYTIFSPAGRPGDALGELWAIWFDGEKRQHTAVKQEFPISEASFSPDVFDVNIGGSTLTHGKMAGTATSNSQTVSWDLGFSGGHEAPIFDLPLSFYDRKLPKAKALVGIPLCTWSGTFTVDGESHQIDNWAGSQNHNWGTKHTDNYAWGQVAGFDESPDSFLEVATARLKFGPVWTPFMTPLVLRHRGETYELNVLQRTFGKGSFRYFDWSFRGVSPVIEVSGRIHANPDDFVGLTYYNPPGGNKTCLNSKIADCTIDITYKDGRTPETLSAPHRAAFEILTDDDSHGVELKV